MTLHWKAKAGQRKARAFARQRGADSKFEVELKDGPLKDCEFQGDKIPYVTEHTYKPDFISPCGKYIIEAKGRFRESSEAAKYTWVRKAIEGDGRELVFLFYNPNTPMPNAKTRKKCGTKRSHSEWAEGQGFRWFTKDNISELFEDKE